MEQNKNNKMPKFSMNWIYVLVIVGLVSVYLMGGDAVSGKRLEEIKVFPAARLCFRTRIIRNTVHGRR